MRTALGFLIAIVTLVAGASAFAHHTYAATYDATTAAALRGDARARKHGGEEHNQESPLLHV
jgi:hypothetical protein